MMETPDKVSTARHVQSTLRCERKGGSPLFMPAIYEHKGSLIGATPSAISRDADLLTAGVLKEYELLRPDALTIGIDVYNLEAEAVGCEVTYYEDDDTSIPGISPNNHIIEVGDDLTGRPLPNPLQDGRMPVNIEAARNVVRELGDEVWVRGAVSGPFSLAVSMVGAESLFIATLDDPDFVHTLLRYTSDIIRSFGKAYIDVGADVIVFDSQASADLLPPTMYEDFILEPMQQIVAYFAEQGVRDVPLIIGGTTTPLVDMLIASKANNLLCDYTCDWQTWLAKCKASNVAIRRNIDSRFILNSNPDDIYATARTHIKESEGFAGYILGTAVIPYGTPLKNILAVKQACLDAAG